MVKGYQIRSWRSAPSSVTGCLHHQVTQARGFFVWLFFMFRKSSGISDLGTGTHKKYDFFPTVNKTYLQEIPKCIYKTFYSLQKCCSFDKSVLDVICSPGIKLSFFFKAVTSIMMWKDILLAVGKNLIPCQVSLEETQSQHITSLILHRAESAFYFDPTVYSLTWNRPFRAQSTLRKIWQQYTASDPITPAESQVVQQNNITWDLVFLNIPFAVSLL